MTRSHSSGYKLRQSGIAEMGDRDGQSETPAARKLIFGVFSSNRDECNLTSDVTALVHHQSLWFSEVDPSCPPHNEEAPSG